MKDPWTQAALINLHRMNTFQSQAFCKKAEQKDKKKLNQKFNVLDRRKYTKSFRYRINVQNMSLETTKKIARMKTGVLV